MHAITQLLQQTNSGFYQLWLHGQQLEQFTQQLHQSLPTQLHPYCQVVNLRQNTLIIHVQAAVWANQLRYLVPEIVQHWQQQPELPNIQHIQIKIRPHYPTTTLQPIKAKAYMSADTAVLLREVAASCEHAALKNALLRLASHAQQKTIDG